MDAVACLVCGGIGGVGGSLAEAIGYAVRNGFDVHGPSEALCPRHRALCVRCHPVEPCEPCSPWLVVKLRTARLTTMAVPHIVSSVRAHQRERWAREYTRAACEELRARGWGTVAVLRELGRVAS